MYRAFTLVLVAALWLPAVAQDPPKATVEDVIKLMEARLAGVKDVQYGIENAGLDMGMGIGSMAVNVSVLRGSGVRIRAFTKPSKAAAQEQMESMLGMIGDQEIVYTTDAVYLLNEKPLSAKQSISSTALRVAYADPAFGWIDPYFLPMGFPIRMAIDDPTLHIQLDPRLFLKLEPNLAYEGRRMEKGRSVHVLSSKLTPGPGSEKMFESDFRFGSVSKEFHIDAETGMILRLRWNMVIQSDMMGESGEQHVGFLMEPEGRLAVTDTFSLPAETRWSFYSGEDGGGTRDSGGLTRRLVNLKVNAGLKAADLLTDAEKSDLYGDAVLLKPAEYDAAIARNPKDAPALFSRAVALGSMSIMAQMMGGMGGAPAVDEVALQKSFETIAELRPASAGARINLLAMYAKSGEAAKEKEILAQVEKGDWTYVPLRLAAIERLNEKGEHARAAKIAGSTVPVREHHRGRLAVEKLLALVASGDEKAILAAVGAEAGNRPTVADKLDLIREFEARLPGLPKDSVKAFTPAKAEEMLTAAAKAAPGELLYPLARVHLHSREFSTRTLQALAGLLVLAPADAAVADFAMDTLGQEFGDTPATHMAGAAAVPPGMEDEDEEPVEKPEAATVWTAESAAPLIAALEGVKGALATDPRVLLNLGRALRLAGQKEKAERKMEDALAACRAVKAGDPKIASVNLALFRLAFEKTAVPEEKWLDGCVDAILALNPDGKNLPSWLLYDETKNPVLTRASKFVADKDWARFYALTQRISDVMLGAYWRLNEKLEPHRDECAAAFTKFALDGAKDVAALKKSAKFSASHLGYKGSIEVLEKAHELAPTDVETLVMLASHATGAGEPAKAISAYERLLKVVREPVTVDRVTWTASMVRVSMATLHLGGQDRVKAKEQLAKIDLKHAEVDRALALSIGSVYAQLDEFDLAIAALLKARELGGKPNFLIGCMYEKKQDPYEALRWYNRDIADPSRDGRGRAAQVQIEEMDEDDGEAPPGDPTNGAQAREQLLKKVGPDFLMKKFLDQKFDPLPAADEKNVRDAVERMSSDKPEEREGGFETLKKVGPKATPLLRDLVKSGDPETSSRVKALFQEWAEPR